MERREFVAGVGCLASSALLSETERRGSAPEVVARVTVQEGAKVPAFFEEGDRVSVGVNVLEGSGVSVAVVGLSGMTREDVTGTGGFVTEIRADGEYILDVTGDGRASITLTLSRKSSLGGKT